MKLVFKPDTPTIKLIIETEAYRQVWKKNSRRIRKAFRQVTGIEFQQASITVRVHDKAVNLSGYFHHPMKLNSDRISHDEKLIVLLHELAHRLLGGNNLSAPALRESELNSHKKIYLFLYDVARQAMGKSFAETLRTDETNTTLINYLSAWNWAMSMSFKERQKRLRQLTAKAKPYRKIMVKPRYSTTKAKLEYK